MSEVVPTGQPVPVVPRSRDQQIRRILSSAGVAIGFLLVTAQEAIPQMKSIYGNAHWFPYFVVTVGILAQVWQHSADLGKITDVNLSAQPDGTSSSMFPETSNAQSGDLPKDE